MKKGTSRFQVKRVYDPPDPNDGTRILVDGIWPRGWTKDALRHDAWLKEIAPSNELRRWFRHEPERWDEFLKRYFSELESKDEIWTPLVYAAKGGHKVTVKTLLEAGADVSVERQGMTALKMATSQGDTDIVRLLREAGATQ